MKKPEVDFLTILHLSELYCKQYDEKGYCFSQEQNDAYFRDFVGQYYGAVYLGQEPHPVINPDIPLF